MNGFSCFWWFIDVDKRQEKGFLWGGVAFGAAGLVPMIQVHPIPTGSISESFAPNWFLWVFRLQRAVYTVSYLFSVSEVAMDMK